MMDMNVISKIDASKYVKELTLAAPKILEMGSMAEEDINVTDNAEQAFVVGDSVHPFVSGVSKQIKWDVLDSVLLAQLHANAVSDRFKDPINWYEAYVDVFNHLGWVFQDLAFEEMQRIEDKEIYDIMLDVASTICTPEEIELTDKYIDSLKITSEALTIWNTNSNNQKNGICKFAPTSLDNDTPTLKLSAFYLTNVTDILKENTGFLDAYWSSTALRIFKAVQIATLDEDIYSQIRANVKAKVIESEKKYIRDIKI
jgi:hypothetical protein